MGAVGMDLRLQTCWSPSGLQSRRLDQCTAVAARGRKSIDKGQLEDPLDFLTFLSNLGLFFTSFIIACKTTTT